MNIEIPGFYYDQVKKKYFKITSQPTGAASSQTSSSSASSKYNKNAIRSSNDQSIQEKKIAKFEINLRKHLRNREFEMLGIGNQIFGNTNVHNEVNDYKIRKMAKASTNYKLNLPPQDKPKMITKIHENNQVILSTLNNIYRILPSEMYEGQFTEQLIHQRTDKTLHSTLRSLQVSRDGNLIIRQWFEDQKHSEVEIINVSNHSQVNIFSEEREWFNNMTYQERTKRVFTVGNNYLKSFDLNHSNKMMKYRTKFDNLSIDYFDASPDELFLGMRNGKLQRIDLRTGKFQDLKYRLGSDSHRSTPKSIINIKTLNTNDLIMSTLGDTLVKFDQRYLSEPLVTFQTLKTSQNIFTENLALHKDKYLVNSNECIGDIEIFNLDQSLPLINLKGAGDSRTYITNPLFRTTKDDLDELTIIGSDDFRVYQYS